MQKENEIFIPGNVPSSKNSKQWTGKMLINSKSVRKYIKNTKEYYENYRNNFKELRWELYGEIQPQFEPR